MDQRKRYQIFVSSTFADLEEERGKVMETILNYDCFPAGMEMFPAMDEEIFEYIKRIIDDSDYFLLIIGGCYGSLAEDGVSWTEKEYDYAVLKGIPVIAFDHEDFTKFPVDKTDQDSKKRKKLIAFKKKAAKGRLIKKWTNKDNLALAVATSLKSVLQLQPRIGWVRAGSIVSDKSQKEIERLQKDIEKYQNEVIRLEAKVKEKDAELKNKDKDYQKEIDKHKEIIKGLEVELDWVRLHLMTETFTVKGVSFKMFYVVGGTFIMGANEGDKEASLNEKHAHEVTLSDYWIGETQVTQELWQAVMGENPSRFKDGSNFPVETVSWDDCQLFIQKLNELTGKEFRLPTEAQWEFAARGGNLGNDHHYQYAGSNDLGKVAWFEGNSDSKTHPVGELEPNELGLYDMMGNVYEWCNDWYDENYYSISPKVDPTGLATGSYRVLRGGCWLSIAKYCRVSYRNYFSPRTAYDYLGLRLAL